MHNPVTFAIPSDFLESLANAFSEDREPTAAEKIAFTKAWLAWRRGLDWPQAVCLEGAPAMKLRNQRLVEAAELLRTEGDSVWTLAGRLRDQVEVFEKQVWKRLRVGGTPRGAIEDRLFDAKRLNGCRALPETRQSYFEILTNGR